MKHRWSRITAAAMFSLVATAAAQTPLSPSGAVNKKEMPSNTLPNPQPGSPAAAAPVQAVGPVPPRPNMPPAEGETGRTAAVPLPESEAATRPRPQRPTRAGGEERRAASQGERHPGDNVADMLNAREMSRITGGGPVPIARPMAPPPVYVLPPPYPPPVYRPVPVYGPPPGYPVYPPPPPIMRLPY